MQKFIKEGKVSKKNEDDKVILLPHFNMIPLVIQTRFDIFDEADKNKVINDEIYLRLENKVRNRAYHKDIISTEIYNTEIPYVGLHNTKLELHANVCVKTNVIEYSYGCLGIFNLDTTTDVEKNVSDFSDENSMIMCYSTEHKKILYGTLSFNLYDIDETIVKDPEYEAKLLTNIINEHKKISKPIILKFDKIEYDSLNHTINAMLKPLIKSSVGEIFKISLKKDNCLYNFKPDIMVKKITKDFALVSKNDMVSKLCEFMQVQSKDDNWKNFDEILNESGEFVNIEVDIINKKYKIIERDIGISVTIEEFLKMLDLNNYSLFEISESNYDDKYFLYDKSLKK